MTNALFSLFYNVPGELRSLFAGDKVIVVGDKPTLANIVSVGFNVINTDDGCRYSRDYGYKLSREGAFVMSKKIYPLSGENRATYDLLTGGKADRRQILAARLAAFAWGDLDMDKLVKAAEIAWGA